MTLYTYCLFAVKVCSFTIDVEYLLSKMLDSDKI